jgi:hypothetical protein
MKTWYNKQRERINSSLGVRKENDRGAPVFRTQRVAALINNSAECSQAIKIAIRLFFWGSRS